MTIQDYEKLTGLTVSTADENRIKAALRRSEVKLESLLGYSLSKPKRWTELGRVSRMGIVPFPSLPLDDSVTDNLLPAEDQVGDIQLFNFDSLNMHLRINPAKEVYRAKIVLPVNENEFVTIYELENLTPYLNSAGLVVALSRYYGWFTWEWWNSLLWNERASLQLAVEAEYVNCLDATKYPDLAYLLADMTTYYSDQLLSCLNWLES